MEAELKTRQSRRSIVLSSIATQALQKHKQLQDIQKQNTEGAWEDHDYVFCNPLGRYIHPNTLRQQFQALLRKAEFPAIRFHDLRHSVATLLLSSGVHPKVVQGILGHSQISMTMDIYSHVLPTMHQDAMDKLNQAFGKSDLHDDDDDNAGGILVSF